MVDSGMIINDNFDNELLLIPSVSMGSPNWFFDGMRTTTSLWGWTGNPWTNWNLWELITDYTWDVYCVCCSQCQCMEQQQELSDAIIEHRQGFLPCFLLLNSPYFLSQPVVSRPRNAVLVPHATRMLTHDAPLASPWFHWVPRRHWMPLMSY